jgi:hypothetical protein
MERIIISELTEQKMTALDWLVFDLTFSSNPQIFRKIGLWLYALELRLRLKPALTLETVGVENPRNLKRQIKVAHQVGVDFLERIGHQRGIRAVVIDSTNEGFPQIVARVVDEVAAPAKWSSIVEDALISEQEGWESTTYTRSESWLIWQLNQELTTAGVLFIEDYVTVLDEDQPDTDEPPI